MGYSRAGFRVLGVDHKPQPNYPFEFICCDALEFVDRWVGSSTDDGWPEMWIDAIHASPPCQLFSAYQRANHNQKQHVNLIPQTRELLQASGLPYIIENVPGAPLKGPVTVCGVSLGLDVRRHRLFESNVSLMTPPCACGGWQEAKYDRGSRAIRPNDRRTVAVGEWRIPKDVQQQAMGIDWMEVKDLAQAIPPLYTELLGAQLLPHVHRSS